IFERKKMKELAVQRADVNQTEDTINQGRYDVILFGLGRYGEEIAVHLRKHNLRILAVDFNPDVVKHWKEKGMHAIYGDGCDQEFLHSLPLKGVKWVISAMPQHDIGITHEDPRYILIDTLKNDNYRGKIIVSTHHRDEEQKLLERGADLVLMPFRGAARYATEQLMELYSKNKP
ncbi:MAG: NAD-binding protein, partial [Flammeovirgaceae bacterium]